MRIRESPPTVPASRDQPAGPAGWPSRVNGCLQLPPCQTSNCQRCGAHQSLWSRQARQTDKCAVFGHAPATFPFCHPEAAPSRATARGGQRRISAFGLGQECRDSSLVLAANRGCETAQNDNRRSACFRLTLCKDAVQNPRDRDTKSRRKSCLDKRTSIRFSVPCFDSK